MIICILVNHNPMKRDDGYIIHTGKCTRLGMFHMKSMMPCICIFFQTLNLG
jgi:hypothetical protein